MGVPTESQVRRRGRRAEPRGSAPRRWPAPSPAAGRARDPAANPRNRVWKSGGDGIRAHHLPLTAERDRTGGGRGAPRPVSLSQASSSTLSSSPVELWAPRRCWAITLFHTRSAHSGNGKERPLSAQAPGERARSPALPLLRLSRRTPIAQAPSTDNEKELCWGSQPQASPAADCAGVRRRPASTMNRTRALAGTATAWDYSSQRAVRQLQAAVGSLGLIRLLVSAAFTIYAVWEIQSFFFLKIYLAVLRDVEAAEGYRSSLFAFLRILKDQLHISEFRRINKAFQRALSVS
uniref:Uncharacterized protein n=1 Tax=Rangifer tarandus platyrhynchus TaxID=3082113 RepID=A0ACB0FNW2_RANTA|nr:unnamed protein product [Rangifer tarandus platyrhynchus]